MFTQIDLPRGRESGLKEALAVLKKCTWNEFLLSLSLRMSCAIH